MSESQQQGSSECGKGVASKPDKTRHSWTAREEEILMASLKELVAQGWKADNGFRAGYLVKLEESMRKEFPGTDIKGMPHINSKIAAWKKSYNSLSSMLDISGLGFNAKGTFMIDCDNDQWEQIVKKDRNARLMRFKSWPLLDSWKDVFGKDRATGANVEDVMEAMHKMYQADNFAQGSVDDTMPHADEEGTATDNAGDSVCQLEKKELAAKNSRKKRKANDDMRGVFEFLHEFGREANARLDNLATCVGYEWDLGMARQTVFEQLGKIPGLDVNEKFDICEIFGR